jgi:hypothetical protein
MKKSLVISVVICVIFIVSCVSSPKPEDTGPAIELQAADAQLKTTGSLQYESGPDRDNIGWWEKVDDEISWDFDVPEGKGGDYKVIVRVACDSEFADSLVGVTINGETLKFNIPDTFEWSSFIDVEVGTISLDTGSYTCVVKGIELKNRFFGNLQSVKLQKL